MENVCIIIIRERQVVEYASGVFYSPKSILTCARSFLGLESPTISARRLTEQHFFDVEIEYMEPSMDLVSLKVIGKTSEDHSNLAIDGTLNKGDKIYTFVSAPNYIAQYVDGYVDCFCPNDYTEEDVPTLCKDFQYRNNVANDEIHNYRKMGHYFNSTKFTWIDDDDDEESDGGGEDGEGVDSDEDEESVDSGEDDSDENYGLLLKSEMVVIKCVGFVFNQKMWGSPVYNGIDEIVGIFVDGGGVEEPAIHVSAIRKFICLLENWKKSVM